MIMCWNPPQVASCGTTRAREQCYCNFGLNPDRLPELTSAGLTVSGADQDGEPRVIELPALRFFVGTLFSVRAAGDEYAWKTTPAAARAREDRDATLA
jgi:CTP synthase (UTP-ammonia lyase)